MLNNLVDLNIKPPDVRVGSNAAIAGEHLIYSRWTLDAQLNPISAPLAYSAACNASGTAQFVFSPPIALTQAPAFDSIAEPILNIPETVVVVGFGAILGGSALWLFANL